MACVRHLCRNHVKMLTGNRETRWQQHVYRIFFYDAVPYDGKAHHPIDNRPIDFGKSNVARDRNALFDLLRRNANWLRLGKVVRDHDWAISGTDQETAAHPAMGNRTGTSRRRTGTQREDSPVTLHLSAEEARSLIGLRELWHSLDGGAVNLGLRQRRGHAHPDWISPR